MGKWLKYNQSYRGGKEERKRGRRGRGEFFSFFIENT